MGEFNQYHLTTIKSEKPKKVAVMKHWQKLVIDPGHFTVLRNLDEEKTKEEVAEQTGINKIRCGKLLDNLVEEELALEEVNKGRRELCLNSLEQRKDSLRDNLVSSTIGGVTESIKEQNFGEARKHLSRDLPTEGEMREKLAKLEAAEKLSELC